MATIRPRRVAVKRETKETKIALSLNLDGQGRNRLSLGIPFLEHMLDLFAYHGGFDLVVKATGDLAVDQHHLVEDLGLTLGQAFTRALGNKQGIVRYGASLLPMDESLVEVGVDISGRPFLAYGLRLRQRKLAEFDVELIPEFLRAVAQNAGLTLHVTSRAGGNTHHQVEAVFKALGRALRQAVARDPRIHGIPSTKGTL